jgi:hypothetical protein
MPHYLNECLFVQTCEIHQKIYENLRVHSFFSHKLELLFSTLNEIGFRTSMLDIVKSMYVHECT